MIEVVAHRGAAALEPENTLRGFRLAIELGADWTECDVRLTRDGRMVLMHDPTVERTTNGSGPVAELSFDEIRSLDAGKGEQVPTLRELLELTRDRIGAQIELKGAGTAEPVVALVSELGMQEQVLFTSFEHDRIRRVKQLDSALQVGALFGERPPDAAEQAVALGARSVHIFFKRLDLLLIEEAHQAGLLVDVWNPDTEADIRAMLAMGADVIGSNYPDMLIRLAREA